MVNFIILKSQDKYICRFFYGRMHIEDFNFSAESDDAAEKMMQSRAKEISSIFD